MTDTDAANKTIYSRLQEGSFYPGDYVKRAFQIENGQVSLPINIADRVLREYPTAFSEKAFKQAPTRRPKPQDARESEEGETESQSP